ERPSTAFVATSAPHSAQDGTTQAESADEAYISENTASRLRLSTSMKASARRDDTLFTPNHQFG
ncbi:MAG: hypothetical protein L0Z71_01795, partial [Anaerolineae bacterium]|nr:hypothetical protein [Anaerolineae bacterium]